MSERRGDGRRGPEHGGPNPEQQAPSIHEQWKQDPWSAWESQYQGDGRNEKFVILEYSKQQLVQEDHARPDLITESAIDTLLQPQALERLRTFAEQSIPDEHTAINTEFSTIAQQALGMNPAAERRHEVTQDAQSAIHQTNQVSSRTTPREKALNALQHLERAAKKPSAILKAEHILAPKEGSVEEDLLNQGDATDNAIQLLDQLVPIAHTLGMPAYLEHTLTTALPAGERLPNNVRTDRYQNNSIPLRLEKRLSGYIDYIAEHRGTLPESITGDPVVIAAMHLTRGSHYLHAKDTQTEIKAFRDKQSQAERTRIDNTHVAVTRSTEPTIESKESNIRDASFAELIDVIKTGDQQSAYEALIQFTTPESIMLLIQERYQRRANRAKQSIRKAQAGAPAPSLESTVVSSDDIRRDTKRLTQQLDRLRQSYQKNPTADVAIRDTASTLIDASMRRDLQDVLSETDERRTRWSRGETGIWTSDLEALARRREGRIDMQTVRAFTAYLQEFHPDQLTSAANGWIDTHKNVLEHTELQPYEQMRWDKSSIQIASEWLTYSSHAKDMFRQRSAHKAKSLLQNIRSATENAYPRDHRESSVSKTIEQIHALERNLQDPVSSSDLQYTGDALRALETTMRNNGMWQNALDAYAKALKYPGENPGVGLVPFIAETYTDNHPEENLQQTSWSGDFQLGNMLWQLSEVITHIHKQDTSAR